MAPPPPPLLVGVRHLTSYAYAAPAWLGPQQARLLPAPRAGVLAHRIEVTPEPERLSVIEDAHGNRVARFTVAGPVRSLRIEVRAVLDPTPVNPFDFLLDDDALDLPFAYGPDDARELATFTAPVPAGGRVEAFLRDLPPPPRPTVDFLADLNRRIAARIAYERRDEPGVREPEETLRLAEGSCRDTAWLQVAILRRLGLAARFASGYLVELHPPAERDNAALHAWAEAWLPGAGWIGLDATSGLLAAEGHVRLAAASHPRGAAPLSGLVDAVPATLEAGAEVVRLAPGEEGAFVAGEGRGRV